MLPIFTWALDPARDADDEDALLDAIARHVLDAGIPLARTNTSFRPLDPQVWARAVSWEQGVVRSSERSRAFISAGTDYAGSTVEQIHRGVPEIREHLDPARPSSYALLVDLASRGFTDYFIKGIYLDRRVRSFISYATKAPGGFTDEHITHLRAIHPAVETLVRIRSLRLTMESVARTYLGANAAKRVLSGGVERGHGENIQAAIWFCDLRDFTVLSQQLPADRLLKLLDRYFETVAAPVADRGGEVLKFIGDAMLAIFPVGGRGGEAPENESGAADACARALAAAEAALEQFATNCAAVCGPELGVDLGIGISLHLGDAFYGNIGARDRLDFTVIGPAVNLASRVQGQCKALGTPLLLTKQFADAVSRPLRSVGTHALKGVAQPIELFTV